MEDFKAILIGVVGAMLIVTIAYIFAIMLTALAIKAYEIFLN
jgi:hypothetical protein